MARSLDKRYVSSNRGNPGFTLTEILVVVSILVGLAALSFPVFNASKKSAYRSVCLSNLKQSGAALQMYRESHGGTDVGTSWQMGLPPHLGVLTPNTVMKCHSDNPDGSGYYLNYPDETVPLAGHLAWQEYAAREGPAAIVFYDPNHQDSFPRSYTWQVWKIMAIRLDGTLVVKQKTGFPRGYSWWSP